MTSAALTTRSDDDGTLFLTGLLEVEVVVRPPHDRLNPSTLFCAVPDGMDGIYGRGETQADAVDCLVSTVLSLLRAPPTLWLEALAAGAQSIGDIHGATSTPGDGNDKDCWNMYATATAYRTAARLFKAADALKTLDVIAAQT